MYMQQGRWQHFEFDLLKVIICCITACCAIYKYNTSDVNAVPYKKIVADNIFTYRELEKISQQEMALCAKISKDTISLIEREKNNVRLDTLEKIALCIGLTLSELLTEDFVKNNRYKVVTYE